MQPALAATTFDGRLAEAIAALDLGQLLELDMMLDVFEDHPVEAVASLSVFLSVCGPWTVLLESVSAPQSAIPLFGTP
jgi:hypothetical protein